ncbi:MAG TPA: phosphoribosyltransferase family protein [Burkholderiaceae bacterium]|nr:phosphoribosyltransferase family protein [Burkholderiaceae bacterium]
MVALALASLPRVGFVDRHDAGERLGYLLLEHLAQERRPLVIIALSRGGVPVAIQVARLLHAPLDLLCASKLKAPGQSALSIGALVLAAKPCSVVNPRMVEAVGATEGDVDAEQRRLCEELELHRQAAIGGRAPLPLDGKVAVLVDDGIVTGATMRAALMALADSRSARAIVAVPVAPLGIEQRLGRNECDFVCVLLRPELGRLSEYYTDFEPVNEAHVVELLRPSGNAAQTPEG